MGCFPPCSGPGIVAKQKIGDGTRRLGATYPRTLLWKVSRPPCPCVCTPVQTGPGGLESGRKYTPQGSISGPKRIRKPSKRSLPAALYFIGWSAHLCGAVGSTRPVANCGLPCALAYSRTFPHAPVPEGVLGTPPGGLVCGRLPLGSQRDPPVFPSDWKFDCGPWATRGRRPAKILIGKLHTGPESPRSPSPSSGNVAVPNGPPTWKPSWSTTSGQPGLGPMTRRPSSSGPPACALPTTTKNRPYVSGSTGPWAPPRAKQAPDGSGGPPQGARWEEPKPDPEQPQGVNGGQWSQDRGSRPWGSGWNDSAGTSDRADYHRANPWGSRATWSSDYTPSDPWHSRGGQGSQGAQDGPWSSYANRQQRQEPREEQRPEENRQP